MCVICFRLHNGISRNCYKIITLMHDFLKHMSLISPVGRLNDSHGVSIREDDRKRNCNSPEKKRWCVVAVECYM